MGAVPLLADPGEQEDLVVHREPEEDGEHQDRVGRVEVALRREAEQVGSVAVAEDPRDHAERRGEGEQVHRDRLHRQHERTEGQEQQHQHHRDDDQPHPGQVRSDRGDQVDGVGRETTDQGAALSRIDLPEVSHDLLGALGLAVAVPDRAQQRRVVRGCDLLDGDHTVDALHGGDVRRQIGLARTLDQQVGRGLLGTELGVELDGRHVGGCVLGQDAVVDAAPAHAEEGAGQGEQADDGHGDDRDRAPHHGACQTTPALAVGQGRPTPPGQPTGVDAASEQSQHGGQQGERGEHGDDHRGDPAVTHRAQEGLREDQQAGHRGGDGETGEEHGPSRGRHGGADRGGRGVRVVERQRGQLLAEAADHEERVVDRETDAEQRDDVDREDRDLGKRRHDPHDREGAQHRDQPHEGRHEGGDDAAEDQQREQHDDRHRDQLGTLEVLAGVVVDVAVDGEGAGDVGLETVGVQQRLDLVVGREVVVLRLPGQRDQHLGSVAVATDQTRVGPVGVVGHDGRGGALGQPGQGRLDGVAEGRVAGTKRVVGVDRDDIDREVAEGVALGLQLVTGLRARVVEAALRERVEDARTEGARPQGQHHARQQDGQCPPRHEGSPTLDHLLLPPYGSMRCGRVTHHQESERCKP
ncbi:unannotated protein [freshwater metagenome]|uniref:Unannotated protein n=1 Tax=freshwater metagenome TaxID=449393 RepID=A0A6J6RW63_9ZZZZ